MKKLAYYFLAVLVLVLVAFIAMIRSDIPVEELKARYTDENSKFMNIDGMNVHYRDEGNGFPLVLIHGMSSSLNTWDGWTEQLKGDFRIIRLDLPGFALTGSHPNNDYSIEFYASFMKTFLQELKIDSCYMAGNSLGGYITWNVAANYPTLVKKMILLDAAGYPFSSDTTSLALKFGKSKIAHVFKKVTPRFVVAGIIKDIYGDDSKVTDEIIDRYYYYLLREGNRDAFLSVASQMQFTQYSKLKNINTPTLIMWGEQDKLIEPIAAKQFNDDLPYSTLIMYPKVGHVPMEEIPVKTAADAKEFLLKTKSEPINKQN